MAEQATRWTDEVRAERAWQSATRLDDVSAAITCEVPMSSDNHRLHRTAENACYPVMVQLDADFSGCGMMASDLRSLAAWLIDVADEADRIDAMAKVEDVPCS